MSKWQNFTKGFFKENPIFVFLLGMCPALAVTSSVESALGMGILVILVLVGSNFAISLLKNLIPDEIRIPAYIVIIATFVTIIQLLTQAFAVDLYNKLGVFIALIVVNCIILGRAEAFASKNNPLDSVIDGVGMGIGFTMAIIIIAFFRELIATGGISYGVYLPLGVSGKLMIFNSAYAINIFTQPSGAFLTLGIILAVIAFYKNYKSSKPKKVEEAK